MSNLSVFAKDGYTVVIDTNGECYYPGYRSLARICSIGLEKPVFDTQVKRVIESEIKGATVSGIIDAEVLTAGGLQRATLIPRKIGTKVIRTFNAELYEEMSEAGHLVFLHQLAGYKVVSQEPPKQLSQLEIILASAQQLVEMDRRQRELEQQNTLLAANLQSIQSDVTEIKNRAVAAENDLKALPPATKECPKRTVRTNINTLVRTYCHTTALPHKDAWNNLYREFRDRCHIDLKIRAANGNCRPLEVAEALDVLDDLYSVAKEIMGDTNA